jgi:hypothetical protein
LPLTALANDLHGRLRLLVGQSTGFHPLVCRRDHSKQKLVPGFVVSFQFVETLLGDTVDGDRRSAHVNF